MLLLVVEDDEAIRETLKLALEHLGHDVRVVSDVEEATEALVSLKPHVVLLDLLIKGTVSTPFIAVAKQLMGEDAPGIIILSAMTGAEKVAEANHVDFLAKPFDIDDLAKLIDGKVKSPES